MKRTTARCFLFLALLLWPMTLLHAQREKFTPAEMAQILKQWPDAKKTSTGLRYVIQKEGTGDFAKPGDLVSVIYRGSVLGGSVFDESLDRNRPFTFRLGRGLVIQGWDQGLKLLKKGTKAILIVPPDLAYGTRGDPPKIGPHATLVFEVEMLDIKSDAGTSSLPPPPKDAPAKK